MLAVSCCARTPVMTELSWGVSVGIRATLYPPDCDLVLFHHQEAQIFCRELKRQDRAGEEELWFSGSENLFPSQPHRLLFSPLCCQLTVFLSSVRTFKQTKLGLRLWDLNTLRVNLNQGAQAVKRAALPQCRGSPLLPQPLCPSWSYL